MLPSPAPQLYSDGNAMVNTNSNSLMHNSSSLTEDLSSTLALTVMQPILYKDKAVERVLERVLEATAVTGIT
jgi:hypothetical protein